MTEAVQSYLDEDNYLRVGAILRSQPHLVEQWISQLEGLACRGPVSGRRMAALQLRFLARARNHLDTVCPPRTNVIDPTCYALVAQRHTQAEALERRFEAAGASSGMAEQAQAWADAWAEVMREPGLQTAHPALLAALLNDAARAYLKCFFAAGGAERLGQARSWLELSVALTPPGSSRAATRRSNLGLVFLELAEDPHTSNPASCRRRALALLREAVQAATLGTAAWTDCVVRLALGRLHSFWTTGSARQLDIAVRELASVLSAGSVPADVAHALGVALRQRFTVRGRGEDLDISLALLSAAWEGTSPTSPDRMRRLLDLGIALLDRHRRDGGAVDLDQAAEALDAALAAAPATCPDRPAILAHCAQRAYRVFETTGSLTALGEARDLADAAARSPSVRSMERGAWLINLGAISEELARQAADLEQFDQTRAIYTEALDLNLPGAVRWVALAGIGACWRDRFVLSREREDLDRAVEALAAAADEVPPQSPDSGRVVLTLSMARFDRHMSAQGRRRGRDARREPGVASGLADLVEALRSVRHLAGRSVPRLDRQRIRAAEVLLSLSAIEVGLEGPSLASLRRRVRRIRAEARTMDPEMLLWTGTLWARHAAAGQRWDDAADGYTITLETLHDLVRRQLERRHGVWWLHSAGQVTAAAAYAAAAAGRRHEAVRLMETGRLVLASEVLALRGRRTNRHGEAIPEPLLTRLNDAVQRLRAVQQAARVPVLRW